MHAWIQDGRAAPRSKGDTVRSASAVVHFVCSFGPALADNFLIVAICSQFLSWTGRHLPPGKFMFLMLNEVVDHVHTYRLNRYIEKQRQEAFKAEVERRQKAGEPPFADEMEAEATGASSTALATICTMGGIGIAGKNSLRT